ncbi:MAG: MFS transporter [Candidatus Faecousia sp.]|nr:MFS transporter [Candidatus Faecousia sp.]
MGEDCKKLTLMPAWRLALACCGLGVLPLYFVRSLPLAAVCVVLFGFAMGGVSTTMDIVGARLLDEDRIKNGIPREGTYSSLIGILNKASGLVSSLAFLLVYRVYGFESGENPGAAPDAAARFLMVLFPVAVFAVCVVMSWFLKFRQDTQKAEG